MALKSIITRISRNIVLPLTKELPFFVITTLLLWKSSTVLVSSGKFVGYLSIWAVISYLLTLFISLFNKSFLKVLTYIVFLSLFAVQHYLLQNFGSPINPTDLTLLAETNTVEIKGFISTYIKADLILPTLKIVCLFVVLIFCSELAWTLVKKRKDITKCVHAIPCLMIITVLILGIYNSKVYYRIITEKIPDRITLCEKPDDFLSSIFSSTCTIEIMAKAVDDAVTNTLEIENISYVADSDSDLNVVLVIGESFNKWHSPIYGYDHNTTPYLDNERRDGRLFAYNEVYTISNSTSVVIKNVFSCNNSSEGEQWFSKPFFPAVFREAGYNVYYWDNQRTYAQHAAFSFTLNGYIYNERIVDFYTGYNQDSFEYDEDFVLSFFEKEGEWSQGHNLVIFHLMGQHFDASQRYPHDTEFDLFTPDSISRDERWLNETYKRRIAEYDNATLYNDHVLKVIMDKYRDMNSILFYFSDHGEEVYDYREQFGRDHGHATKEKLKYQYEIPFFIWTSSKYVEKHPEVIEQIKRTMDYPLMSDIISHTMINLAGIECPYYNPKYDFLNPSYECNHRIIDGLNVEIDDILESRD